MSFKRRKIATIDLGSNSMLMLIACRDEDGAVKVLADEINTPRLAQGLEATGAISSDAMDRACEGIKSFMKQANEHTVELTQIVATSAARDASNADELKQKIKEASSLDLEILDSSEEARLTYLSVTRSMVAENGDGDAPTMVIDIGGGSTEITWGLGPRFDGGRSLRMGTVRILEKHIPSDPPGKDAVENAKKEVDRHLARVTPLGKLDHYLGTAGTFTQLAAIEQQLESYHPSAVDGYELTKNRIEYWIDRLSQMTKEERLAIKGIDPRRQDVLLPGAIIIERLMKKFHTDTYRVFDRGIRFGKFFDRIRKFNPPIQFS